MTERNNEADLWRLLRIGELQFDLSWNHPFPAILPVSQRYSVCVCVGIHLASFTLGRPMHFFIG